MTRFAIVSAPRSGNSWVRRVLCDALGIKEDAQHNYLNFRDMPDATGIQIHWPREPNFQKFLKGSGFRPVVILRHPLDILCSVMHFIRHEPATSRWLEGNGDIPSDLVGQDPASDAFLRYATGFGAETLLSPSYQWFHDPASILFRYEEGVARGAAAFYDSFQCLGLAPGSIERALVTHDLGVFQALPNKHGWQGMPGLWRDIVPSRHAQRIYERHKTLFDTLGYGVPETDLDVASARGNWTRLCR